MRFEAASFDAVICECAFCTFPNKAAAAAAFTRVLRPVEEYAAYFETAGLSIGQIEPHPHALGEMVKSAQGKLLDWS